MHTEKCKGKTYLYVCMQLLGEYILASISKIRYDVVNEISIYNSVLTKSNEIIFKYISYCLMTKALTIKVWSDSSHETSIVVHVRRHCG